MKSSGLVASFSWMRSHTETRRWLSVSDADSGPVMEVSSSTSLSCRRAGSCSAELLRRSTGFLPSEARRNAAAYAGMGRALGAQSRSYPTPYSAESSYPVHVCVCQ